MLDESAAGQRVPLVFVKSIIEGVVEPAGFRLRADVALDVAAQRASRLRFELPASGVLASVEKPPAESAATTAPGNAASTRLHFAFWNEQFKLGLLANARDRELGVEVASLVDVVRSGLTLRASVTVEPRYAPLFDLALELP